MKLRESLLWAQTLHQLAEQVVSIFVTLYLWRTFSITTALSFKLVELFAIPVMIFVVGWLIDRWSVKVSLILGMVLMLVQLGLFAAFADRLRDWLLMIALVSGASAVARFMTWNVIHQQAISIDEQPIYFAQLSLISRVIGLVFPVISGFIVLWLGYGFLFGLASLFAIFVAMTIGLAPISVPHNPFLPWWIFQHWRTESNVLFGVNALWGIEYGLLMVLMPIVTTQLAGGESGWGMITSAVALVAIGYTWLFKRSKIADRGWAAVGIFGFLLAVAALTFVADQQLISFIGLIVVVQLWQATQMMGLRPLLSKLVARDDLLPQLVTEYQMFQELPFMIGRVMILALLVIIGQELQSSVVIGFLFAGLALIPLYESKLIASSQKKRWS